MLYNIVIFIVIILYSNALRSCNNKGLRLKTLLNNNQESKTILPILDILNNDRDIILASGSPRRRELMHLIGLKFRVITSSFEENLDKNEFKEACQYCLITAKHKALDVIKNLEIKGTVNKGTILISSDTIVEIDNTILEKPKDRDDAIKMLTLLRGRTHQVHTSICLYSNMNDNKKLVEVDSFVSTSSITFSKFSDDDLLYYVSTSEPYDKAGSYGIQGLGSVFVESISGDYFTIMGFPIFLLSKKLVSLYHSNQI